jgi:hypothetical protein
MKTAIILHNNSGRRSVSVKIEQIDDESMLVPKSIFDDKSDVKTTNMKRNKAEQDTLSESKRRRLSSPIVDRFVFFD